MKKTTQLRQLLTRPRAALVCGAYDGISAYLAERAGFDAVWASGFCISASKRLADVGLVTMSEHVAATREINRATRLPVIADADDGFGDAVIVSRTVAEYEAAGAAAVCLEDNRHPKRSSLYGGMRRGLVSCAEFADKIRAAREFRSDPDFMVIARTEALIAGMGVAEALRRAKAYARAGADMILVHSKDPRPGKVKKFARRWDLDVPLVAVPTTYARTKVPELQRAGFRMVIFANQGLRAAVAAMDRTFRQILESRGAAGAEKTISPLSEIYSIVGLEKVRDIEARFMSSCR